MTVLSIIIVVLALGGASLTGEGREIPPSPSPFLYGISRNTLLPFTYCRRTEIDLKEEEREKRDAWNFLFFSLEGLYVVARPAQRVGLGYCFRKQGSVLLLLSPTLFKDGEKGTVFFLRLDLEGMETALHWRPAS